VHADSNLTKLDHWDRWFPPNLAAPIMPLLELEKAEDIGDWVQAVSKHQTLLKDAMTAQKFQQALEHVDTLLKLYDDGHEEEVSRVKAIRNICMKVKDWRDELHAGQAMRALTTEEMDGAMEAVRKLAGDEAADNFSLIIENCFRTETTNETFIDQARTLLGDAFADQWLEVMKNLKTD